jgi:mannitol/fructose-specific phosphotransferase system IIA component (Ntr-type)
VTLILKREGLGSTGVGNGVALPHARLVGLKAPFSLFAHRRAIDDQPVDIVFLLLLPESDNSERALLTARGLSCAPLPHRFALAAGT